MFHVAIGPVGLKSSPRELKDLGLSLSAVPWLCWVASAWEVQQGFGPRCDLPGSKSDLQRELLKLRSRAETLTYIWEQWKMGELPADSRAVQCTPPGTAGCQAEPKCWFSWQPYHCDHDTDCLLQEGVKGLGDVM